MGFFRMFYFLKRILFKIPKKLLVYILIFIIIMLFTTSSHASQIDVNNVPNADIVQMYKLQMDTNWLIFLQAHIKKAKNNNNRFDPQLVSRFYSMTQYGSRYVWGVYDAKFVNLFFTDRNGTSPNFNDQFIFLVFANVTSFTNSSSLVIPGTSNSSYSSSREIASSLYTGADVLRISPVSSGSDVQSQYNIEIIDAFQRYIPDFVFQTVYNIGLNQFDFTSVDNTLDEISQKLDETNEQLEQMNEFFNSTTTPTITNNDLPSDNLNDVTQSSFNGIFTKIYNKTLSTSVETVSIPIPFLNYSFNIRSDYVYNAVISLNQYIDPFTFGQYTFLGFIELLWSFFIYRYIVLDIYKYINDFKNGNISKTDTNIKADML